MRFKITKIQGGKAMRTNSMVGEGDPPLIGRSFVLWGKPLDPVYDGRRFETSPVMEVSYLPDGQGLLLHTMTGSRYLLEAM